MDLKKTLKNIKRNWLILTALLVASTVFITSILVLISHLLPPAVQYDQYKNITTDFDEYDDTIYAGPNADFPINPINFEALKETNPDVCAWIKVQGTNIDYPILRSGADKEEDYYLNHTLENTESLYGSVYIQKMNSSDFSDYHTVIYGHNMLNGSMFGKLKKFRDPTFFNENSYIYVYMPKHILKYRIFSAYIYDDRHILMSYNNHIAQGRQAYIDYCLNPDTTVKNIREDVKLSVDDKLITLSTCTNKKTERYLVVGKLVENIETQ